MFYGASSASASASFILRSSSSRISSTIARCVLFSSFSIFFSTSLFRSQLAFFGITFASTFCVFWKGCEKNSLGLLHKRNIDIIRSKENRCPHHLSITTPFTCAQYSVRCEGNSPCSCHSSQTLTSSSPSSSASAPTSGASISGACTALIWNRGEREEEHHTEEGRKDGERMGDGWKG